MCTVRKGKDMEHSRLSNYEHALDLLRMRLNEMFSSSLEAFKSSMESLENSDVDLAKEVINSDDKIDLLKREIEELVYEILGRFQPLASDLRRVIMAMKIAGELERVADQAVNIAQVTEFLKGKKLIKPLVDIPKMAQIATDMMARSMRAYFDEDVELAKQVWLVDDQVDDLDRLIVDDIEEVIKKYPTDEVIKQSERIILVSRAIERIADHATNICEESVYMILGKELFNLL